MKNKSNKSQYVNTMLNLSNDEFLQVYDYVTNQIYTYFENELIPQLKRNDSGWMFDREVKTAINKQREFLSYLDDIREVIENKDNRNE